MTRYLGIGCHIKQKKLDSVFELGYGPTFAAKASFKYPLSDKMTFTTKVDTAKTFDTDCSIELDKNWSVHFLQHFDNRGKKPVQDFGFGLHYNH